jgi:8-oxo-dGTP diphosphatase
MKQVEVVAALIIKSGRVLCVQRGENKYHYISKKWEFPGGKLEQGEGHETALVREIAEELHVRVSVGVHMVSVEHKYPDFVLTMHAYRCELAHKSIPVTLTEHVAHRWLMPSELSSSQLDWAAADVPIVTLLQSWPI